MDDLIQNSRGDSNDICVDHREKVVSFCFSCTTFVCSECEEHYVHTECVKDLKSAMQFLKTDTPKLIKAYHDIISKSSTSIEELSEKDKHTRVDAIISALTKFQKCATVDLFWGLAEKYKNFIDDKYEKLRRLKDLLGDVSTLHDETDPTAFISKWLETTREATVLSDRLNTDKYENDFLSFIRDHTNAKVQKSSPEVSTQCHSIPSAGEIDELADKMLKTLEVTTIERPTITVNMLTQEIKKLKSQIRSLKSKRDKKLYTSRLKSEIASKDSTILELRMKLDQIEEKRNSKKPRLGLKECAGQIDTVQNKINQLTDERSKMESMTESVKFIINNLQSRLYEKELALTSNLQTIKCMETVLNESRARVNEKETALENCLQKIQFVEKELMDAHARGNEKETALKNCLQKIQRLQRELEGAHEREQESTQKYESAQTEIGQLVHQTHELKNDIQKLKSKEDALQTRLIRSIDEKEKFQKSSVQKTEEQAATIQGLTIALQNMKEELHEREKEISQIKESAQTKINQLVEESNTLENRIKELESEKEELHTSIDEKENSIQTIKKQTATIQRLKSMLQNKDKELHAQEQENSQITESAQTKISQLVERSNALENKIHELRSERDYLHNSIEENEKEKTKTIEEQASTIQHLTITLQNKETDVQARTQEIAVINKSAQTKINQLVEQSNEFENKIQELKSEKDDLQTRLSSVAGQKLTSKNPAITNLADPNRPMKIGERYGELYDNDWTDAMERVSTIKQYCPGKSDSEVEEIVIHYLHRIVRCCYEGCLELARRQISDVFKILGYDQHEVQHADEPSINDLVSFRQKKAGHFAKKLIRKKAFYDEILDGWDYPLKHEGILKELIDCPFYDKCLELCWYMVIQDPVMYIDDVIPAGAVINKDMYREFTKSGKKVAFVVWPALLLHKNGPVLYKGVVQVK